MNSRSNSLNLQQDEFSTYVEALESRPKNTTISYGSKTDEFIKWMQNQNFLDGITVSGSKILSFLRHEIVDRVYKNDTSKKIGYSTVRSYGAACVDLYKKQVSLNQNSNPHPKDTPALKTLFNTLKNKESERRRKNFEDRGIGTLQDGYSSISELKQISNSFFINGEYRDQLMFLLSHFCLMRGESVRRIEWADLFHLLLQNEGFSECMCLVVITDQGKTNQFGRKELGAAIRNKDPEICPVGCLAFYLFFYWHVLSKLPPDFSTSQAWFENKLFPGKKGPTTEITYQTHLDSVKKCLSRIGMTSKAKTHIGRGSGARMAELNGASDSDIRRLGRWNSQAMEGCYLTALPRGALRTMAGFAPDGGSYYISRSNCVPSLSLQEQIFPWLSSWSDEIEYEKTLAVDGFINLLKYFRIVILQDAAILVDNFPDNQLFKHDIFQCQDFKDFKASLLASIEERGNPSETRIQQAMPDMLNHINTLGQSLGDKLNVLASNISEYGTTLKETSTFLREVFDGKRPIFLNSNAYPDISPIISSTVPQAPSHIELPNPTMESTNSGQIVSYIMSRGVSSVTDAWREYKHGLYGGPSVEFLETNYNNNWRKSPKERKFFSRRNVLYKKVLEIRNLKQITEDEAVKILEAARVRMNVSLDSFQKKIAKGELSEIN
jgi:hypothetical protein